MGELAPNFGPPALARFHREEVFTEQNDSGVRFLPRAHPEEGTTPSKARGKHALGSQFEEDVFAEVAAISLGIAKAIGELGSLSSDKGPYLSRILEAGLKDLEKIDYQNIPEPRRAAFREKVKARYIDLIAAIPTE